MPNFRSREARKRKIRVPAEWTADLWREDFEVCRRQGSRTGKCDLRRRYGHHILLAVQIERNGCVSHEHGHWGRAQPIYLYDGVEPNLITLCDWRIVEVR